MDTLPYAPLFGTLALALLWSALFTAVDAARLQLNGALRTGEIPGTGHLQRILFNEKMEELRRESLLTDLRQRIRDVRQGTDGLLYVITDEKVGAVLRIEPQ